MKFSLKAIFAILTIACLSALVYQQWQRIESLNQREKDLQSQLESFDPKVEQDLPMLQLAAQPNREFEAVFSQVETANKQTNNEFGKQALNTPDNVSIAHLPELSPVRKSFSIFIPESKNAELQIFATADFFGGDLKTATTESPFNLNQNTSVKLRAGLSQLSLQASADDPDVWLFMLNDKTICQAQLKDQNLNKNMIWLMGNKNFLGSLRHESIDRRVMHVCKNDESKIEFASFYTEEFKMNYGKPSVEWALLKCTLVVTEKNEAREAGDQ